MEDRAKTFPAHKRTTKEVEKLETCPARSKMEQPLTQIWNDQHAVSFLYNLLQHGRHTWKLWNLSLHPDLALILSGRMCCVLLLTMLVLKWKHLALSSIHPHRACKQSTQTIVKLEHSPLKDYPASVGVYVQNIKEMCAFSKTLSIKLVSSRLSTLVFLPPCFFVSATALFVNLTHHTSPCVILQPIWTHWKIQTVKPGLGSPCSQAQQMQSKAPAPRDHMPLSNCTLEQRVIWLEEKAVSHQQGRGGEAMGI